MMRPASPTDGDGTLPAEEALDAHDATYLRQAIALSWRARERGNRPFGAVIVGRDGQVLAEASNANGETGDCTAHAETSAVRAASQMHGREGLAGSTIYSSGEPCVMCAGAIFWGNIRRVVFGIDAERLRAFRGDLPDQVDLRMSCREVFASASRPPACVGPALIEEASAAHVGAWR